MMAGHKSNCVEAENVFVLMTNEYRVSRNIRAQWYFKNLNKRIELKARRDLSEFTEEIEIISVVNSSTHVARSSKADHATVEEEQEGLEEESDEEPCSYYISPNTKIVFLARRYRFVYILDLSPSLASGDIQNNSIINEEVFTSLSSCLRGLCNPFYVPGSELFFTPEIYITVLAHTSFYTGIKEVLIQGWKLTCDNVDRFLSIVNERLVSIISLIASITAKAIEQREINIKGEDGQHSVLYNGESSQQNKFIQPPSTITVTAPDISMVNMYRYGLLSLHLLPENSNTGIVIITDGMLCLPNSSMLESMLAQLRNSTIACSFIQVGSSPHPDSCLGYLPYTDLMKFISIATFGAYLPNCPHITNDSLAQYEYNLYHRAFLSWNFQRGLAGFKPEAAPLRMRLDSEWVVKNPYFFSSNEPGTGNFDFDPKDQELLRNRQMKNTIPTKLTNVLSCRLREGFTIKRVYLTKNDSQIEVVLVLPWKYNVNIEYILKSFWKPDSKKLDENDYNETPECSYEVIIEGTYNFIHDVTCQVKRPIRSPFRVSAVKQFWATLKSLSDSDKILTHLSNFGHEPASPIPESILSGVPLFYLPPNSSKPVLASKNSAHQLFALYWRQICLLDLNSWQKWMHLHRINVILRADQVLPKYLHIPNANGKYMHVQCRQALASLSVLLKDYSSFVMLENHSYIKFISSEENGEKVNYFFMIRVIANFPCVVLHLAFINGTSGLLRHQVMKEMREMIRNCKFQIRNVKSGLLKSGINQNILERQDSLPLDGSLLVGQHLDQSSVHEASDDLIETNACVILRKPIEKVLIRYEKPPIDFFSPVDQHFFSLSTSENVEVNKIIKEEMMATLSRYLHHERWIWTPEQISSNIDSPNKSISIQLLGKILSTLLRKRLDEGFHFAHSSGNGIISVALEIKMTGECDKDCPNIVQYVLFPPHKRLHNMTLQWQLVTECWIEPQQGFSVGCEPGFKYLENKDYKDIAASFYAVDNEVITELLHNEGFQLVACESVSSPVWNSNQ